MRRQDKMPARNKKNFRPTKSGAGMTRAGVAAYRRKNPGSKLKTAVTGKVKPGSKAAKRRKSFCARSAGQMKKFPKAKDPNSRLNVEDGSVKHLYNIGNTRLSKPDRICFTLNHNKSLDTLILNEGNPWNDVY